MSKRWGAWTRLGVVLTGVWLIAVPVAYWLRAKGYWTSVNDMSRSFCFNAEFVAPSQLPACLAEIRTRDFPDAKTLGLGFLSAFIIAILVWALAFLTAKAIRWILAGRKASE